MACALLQDNGILYLDGIQFDVFYDDDSNFYDDDSTQWQVPTNIIHVMFL